MMTESKLVGRRDLLIRGLRTGAAVGLGSLMFGSLSDSSLVVSKAMASVPGGALDFVAVEPCILTCTAMLGPCYFSPVLDRRDITEASAGKIGLPTRLAFRVVDVSTCEPVAGATVDIWHTDNNGVYSAPIGQICNSTDPSAQQMRFGRGVQATDANGWAYFDTFFPGWYPGRVTHIHATIRVGTTAMATTQFYFADRVSEFIYRSHPNYSHRPGRDRTNATDGLIGGSLARVEPFLFSTRLVNNKFLQAIKVIGIQQNPTTCQA